MDYRKYQFCAKERILIVFESIAVTAVIAFLCYRSVYVMAGMYSRVSVSGKEKETGIHPQTQGKARGGI